ncbi:MetQ/NlpA family ABC transporter substrate-binding protein [Streptococcus pluranimalium]|uniref:MetQ/NlpA family ABC transporter substrate-binding protein n=1 Tax=Streptococcus pluranimalium TaxID=82348 RepID=UPI00136B8D84|nr:MetQ/NlpA family ABC transporter substrate-binding protein [Streptococcus pluranimalium]MXQ49350.1 MetQ/NlpA family ABC transporter substrate-binding protein [Streptococcus pneumoniae]WFM80219.1 MetQ/NlpA family ABC transporter substrate-binding protein [Streptococcus pluranimalium]HEM6116060.1 MetQ/NlpA family ABC transporter substrate-binding protein [Streptococcus suis]
MTFKKVLGIAGVALASTVVLAACSGDNSADDKNVVRVGIMTKTDATEPIWDRVEELAEKEGVELKFTEFTDYTQPNKALKNGEIDVNAFQHYNFLNDWNKKNDGDLVAAADTLLSPIHLFSGLDGKKAKYTDVKDIPKGATISVPNDATNESRALYVLQSAGLIKLSKSGEEVATLDDITSNPKDLDIKEIAADQAASTLTSVDAAVVNNNYAVDAGVDYDTSIFTEEKNDSSKQWINVIAAQKDWKKSAKADAINTLIDVYQTDEVAKIIKKASKGTDIAIWEGAPEN